MPTNAPNARELTRHLIARAAEHVKVPESAALMAQEACERTLRALTRSLGQTGSRALLTRALAQAEPDHPLLKDLRIGRQSEPGLDGVPGIVQVHGAPAVAAALVVVLDTLLGLLGRLIGDDMVVRLVEQSTPMGMQDDEDVK